MFVNLYFETNQLLKHLTAISKFERSIRLALNVSKLEKCLGGIRPSIIGLHVLQDSKIRTGVE